MLPNGSGTPQAKYIGARATYAQSVTRLKASVFVRQVAERPAAWPSVRLRNRLFACAERTGQAEVRREGEEVLREAAEDIRRAAEEARSAPEEARVAAEALRSATDISRAASAEQRQVIDEIRQTLSILAARDHGP
jgi:hypothetical protein